MSKALENMIAYPIAVSLIFIVIGAGLWIVWKVDQMNMMPTDMADAALGTAVAVALISAIYGAVVGLAEEAK